MEVGVDESECRKGGNWSEKIDRKGKENGELGNFTYGTPSYPNVQS